MPWTLRRAAAGLPPTACGTRKWAMRAPYITAD